MILTEGFVKTDSIDAAALAAEIGKLFPDIGASAQAGEPLSADTVKKWLKDEKQWDDQKLQASEQRINDLIKQIQDKNPGKEVSLDDEVKAALDKALQENPEGAALSDESKKVVDALKAQIAQLKKPEVAEKVKSVLNALAQGAQEYDATYSANGITSYLEALKAGKAMLVSNGEQPQS